MKVKIVSDLHLEFCGHGYGIPELGSGDILILGGDILCARHFKTDGKLSEIYSNFLKKCSDEFKHVLYIAGNHEPYSYNWEKSWDVLREHLPENVRLLDNDYVEIDDWVFLGCTLWTDFYGANPLAMMDAGLCMNDYKTIKITPKYRKLNPDDTLEFNKKSREFLHSKVQKFKDKNVWVLTHHSPSHQSIAGKYKGYGITNAAYVNDLDEWIIQNPNIKYWSHGHTHESFSYPIGQCQVICNPRGYFTGVNSNDLNPNFDPDLEIQL